MVGLGVGFVGLGVVAVGSGVLVGIGTPVGIGGGALASNTADINTSTVNILEYRRENVV